MVGGKIAEVTWARRTGSDAALGGSDVHVDREDGFCSCSERARLTAKLVDVQRPAERSSWVGFGLRSAVVGEQDEVKTQMPLL